MKKFAIFFFTTVSVCIMVYFANRWADNHIGSLLPINLVFLQATYHWLGSEIHTHLIAKLLKSKIYIAVIHYIKQNNLIRKLFNKIVLAITFKLAKVSTFNFMSSARCHMKKQK